MLLNIPPNFNIGDHIAFEEGDYEYEAEVLGINADYIVTIQHATTDGDLVKRCFGGRHGEELNIVEINGIRRTDND